jgi:hypothetical protein
LNAAHVCAGDGIHLPWKSGFSVKVAVAPCCALSSLPFAISPDDSPVYDSRVPELFLGSRGGLYGWLERRENRFLEIQPPLAIK